MAFVNLHRHDHGSLLDGAGTPEQGIKKAHEIGQDAIAITNHGNLITAPDYLRLISDPGFMEEYKSVKPIIGMEAYFVPDATKKDKYHKKSWHLSLLAKNEQGFKNLIKLQSKAHTEGFYGKPRIDYKMLQEHSEGLMCNSGCLGGYLSWLIQQNDHHAVDECIERHLQIFGDDYRLEIMPHDIPAQVLINLSKAELSLKYDIPLVATGDSHYPFPDWKDTQDVLLMIATGQTRSKREAKREAGEDVYEIDVQLHMFSEEEMYELFAVNHKGLTKQCVAAAIEESAKIADQIETYQMDTSNKFPKISTSPEQGKAKLLAKCRQGMKRIGKEGDKTYEDRLEREIGVIEKVGAIDYFLMVSSMVSWAREQGIRISSGRGSAAGSLVCYLTKITTIDPIAHDLLFERFMNENRKGLPDIDLDFDSERREEVKEWLAKEYGEDKVCNIAAFGTYNPKGAIKDVARVLDVPFGYTNAVTKRIPDAQEVGGAANVPPLAVLREQEPLIDDFAKKYPEAWKHARRIEGQLKNLSKHAGGVVVTDQPITDYVPLLHGKSGIVTSWSDRANFPVISNLGLVKIDILGLDGLTKQGNTIKVIEKLTGEKIDLDELEITRNPDAVDPDVMRLFQKGLTLGVFQFGGSRGIIQFLKHTKPDRFEDLIAVNALYRPGALEGGDAFKYGDIKKGKIPPSYWHESVEPYLQKTYGIMVYQEQLQQIAQALGDFSPSESDDMRKATSKVYRMGKAEAREFMSKYKEQWMKGCDNHGLSEEQAEDIWERMLAFGSYSFNRSHSASYALAGYQDAYLKSRWTEAFYSSLLSKEDQDELEKIIRECNALGVQVMPPDINRSEIEFTIEDGKLLYGLESVKYVGEEAALHISSVRSEGGPFTSFENFEERTTKRKCNKRVKEFLIKAGAFDEFGMREDWSIDEKREAEIESIGIALSGTGDSEKYAELLKARTNTEDDFEMFDVGETLTVGGEIVSAKPHIIKSGKNKGKEMGWIDLVFQDSSFKVVAFNKEWEKYNKSVLKTGNVVLVQGKKDDRDQVICKSAITAEDLMKAIEKG